VRRIALVLLVASILSAPSGLVGAEFPQAEISNSIIHAKFFLPDPDRGYYRGTRFDWSGIIYSLQYNGHEYFGQWFARYDPKIHDAIMGPVEEYLTNDAGLGYEEAKAGGTFIRIGVGVVRKPEEKAYGRFETYEIVDPGKWNVKKGPDWIEFTHELKDTLGYAYLYTKKLQLAKNKPELVLEHTLKNTGQRVIETAQYNHNFFVIDQQPTGPDFVVKFPFDVRAKQELNGIAKAGGRRLEYLRELEKDQSMFTELEGFGASAKDYDFRIENRKVGAGVRITGDQPLVKLVYWCIRTTLCPEPYVQIKVEPGRESKWRIRYEFYTLSAASTR
jgi:hypothetical protein